MENDCLINIPFSHEVLGMLISDLLSYNSEKHKIPKLKTNNPNHDKPYIIKIFKDHIHLSTKDPSDYVPIPVFSSKLNRVIKKLINFYDENFN